MDFKEMNANKCVVNMQGYSLLMIKVVFWMFSLLLRFPANRSFFSMIFSGQEEKNLCHAMPCHHTKGLTHDQVSNKAMTG